MTSWTSPVLNGLYTGVVTACYTLAFEPATAFTHTHRCWLFPGRAAFLCSADIWTDSVAFLILRHMLRLPSPTGWDRPTVTIRQVNYVGHASVASGTTPLPPLLRTCLPFRTYRLLHYRTPHLNYHFHHLPTGCTPSAPFHYTTHTDTLPGR